MALFIVSLQTWYVIDVSKIPGGDRLIEQYAEKAGFALTANAWEPWGFLNDFILFAVIVGTLAAVVWVLLGGGRLAGTVVLMIGIAGLLQQLMHLLSGPAPSELVEIRPVAWLGLLSTLAIALGGFLCLEAYGGIRGAGQERSRGETTPADSRY